MSKTRVQLTRVLLWAPYGAEGGTRTRTGYTPTWPSTMRVYQFHHLGMPWERTNYMHGRQGCQIILSGLASL